MNLLWLLIVVGALLLLFGNPHMGARVYPGYSYGYFPGGIGLIVVIVVLVLIFR